MLSGLHGRRVTDDSACDGTRMTVFSLVADGKCAIFRIADPRGTYPGSCRNPVVRMRSSLTGSRPPYSMDGSPEAYALTTLPNKNIVRPKCPAASGMMDNSPLFETF